MDNVITFQKTFQTRAARFAIVPRTAEDEGAAETLAGAIERVYLEQSRRNRRWERLALLGGLAYGVALWCGVLL